MKMLTRRWERQGREEGEKRGSPAIFQGPWLYDLPERPAQTAGTDNRPSLLDK